MARLGNQKSPSATHGEFVERSDVGGIAIFLQASALRERGACAMREGQTILIPNNFGVNDAEEGDEGHEENYVRRHISSVLLVDCEEVL